MHCARLPRRTPEARLPVLAAGHENSAMDWNRIASNWTHWKDRIRERWGRLTDEQLLGVGGRRDQLAGRIQEAYGLSRDEAERQLRNWERNLDVEENIDDDDGEGVEIVNGRS
jgi:uncharacterized protein YjbJ (UPF0337 family)